MIRREIVLTWLEAGIAAVQPDRLTEKALGDDDVPGRVIAIGKAAAAMCRGAEKALGSVSGLCITNHRSEVPTGVELLMGDHPVPGPGSLEAGQRALQFVPEATIALISGGGSALCEVPRQGLSIDDLAVANRRLLAGGASIEETNLVRRHLSKVKSGGLGPIRTYILSDVAGADPGVVSSGPTIPADHRPDAALAILDRYEIPVDSTLEDAIRTPPPRPPIRPEVTVVGDGRTAAHAVAEAAHQLTPSTVVDGWLTGDFESGLHEFISDAPPGVSVLAGEPSVLARGNGRGGRNTHSALRAAQLIAESEMVFAALATDGEDGSSGSAGAVVDGSTVATGGDPAQALENCDSATYLDAIGSLIQTGPTGTNVADIWLIWKPDGT